jgi:uncharacterized YigZ family protein
VSPALRAPTAPARAEVRDQGSRFFAHLVPVDSVEAAQAELARLRVAFPDATHHCFAWRLGAPPVERGADAGEPAGTAGAPMLAVLRGAGLTDVLAVVARYFGGTKLGRGGLARAYAEAVRQAVAGVATREVVERVELDLVFAYERVGAVRRLFSPGRVELVAERYGEAVEMTLAVAVTEEAAVVSALADLALAPRARRAGHSIVRPRGLV